MFCAGSYCGIHTMAELLEQFQIGTRPSLSTLSVVCELPYFGTVSVRSTFEPKPWTMIGVILAMSCHVNGIHCVGRILAVSWPHHGRILAASSPHPRRILAASWPHPGHILATSWPRPGHILAAPSPGPTLANFGPTALLLAHRLAEIFCVM